MWRKSRVLELLNIKLPIIQAPMAGGLTTPELIAAVSNAGGLGSLGAGFLEPSAIQKNIREIRALTNKPFAVNLFIPRVAQASVYEQQEMCDRLNRVAAELNVKTEPREAPFVPNFAEQMAVILEEKVPVFSFTFGIPEKKWLAQLNERAILAIGTATSLAEAKALEAEGIPLIVAQSKEAGGHRGSFLEDARLNNEILISQLANALKTPIISAGGIMNSGDIKRACLAGAEAVQMGTVFLTCTESGAHPIYKKTLLTVTEDRTVLTKAFTGKWARALNNKFIQVMQNACVDYPIQHALTSPIRKAAALQNNIEFMAMWAGQRSFLCQAISATELLKNLEQIFKAN